MNVCVNRCERLEEQLNDLTELHQNEILNLKQELASMEEKIAYQSYERARDIQVSEPHHAYWIVGGGKYFSKADKGTRSWVRLLV